MHSIAHIEFTATHLYLDTLGRFLDYKHTNAEFANDLVIFFINLFYYNSLV